MPTQVGTLVYSIREMAKILQGTLELEQATTGLEGVYFGTTLIPTYPSAVVELGPKERTLQEAASRFRIDFTIYVNILHGKIQDGTVTANEMAMVAEAVEEVLHTDYTFDNRIIFGHVTKSAPGVIRAGSIMLRAHRLTWEGLSKEGF